MYYSPIIYMAGFFAVHIILYEHCILSIYCVKIIFEELIPKGMTVREALRS
jgi:hypothetical protein